MYPATFCTNGVYKRKNKKGTNYDTWNANRKQDVDFKALIKLVTIAFQPVKSNLDLMDC